MSVSVSNSVLRASATWLKVEKFNSADPLPPKRGREGVVLLENETLLGQVQYVRLEVLGDLQ